MRKKLIMHGLFLVGFMGVLSLGAIIALKVSILGGYLFLALAGAIVSYFLWLKYGFVKNRYVVLFYSVVGPLTLVVCFVSSFLYLIVDKEKKIDFDLLKEIEIWESLR